MIYGPPRAAGGSLQKTALVLATVGLVSSILAACSSNSHQALVHEGNELAREYGCISCHTSDGSNSVGPTWKGLYTSKVELDDGSVVVADEPYLRESILRPTAKTVKGFEKGLMETVIKPNSVSEKEVAALIAYIKSLR